MTGFPLGHRFTDTNNGKKVISQRLLDLLHKASGDPTYEIAHRVTGLGANSLAVVARLFTDGAFRRRGVGRALIEHATVAAHADGRRPVLDVGQCLPAAIALYEAAGWTRLDGFRLEVRQGSLNLWVYLGPPP